MLATFFLWNLAFAPTQEDRVTVRTVIESQHDAVPNPLSTNGERLTASTLYLWSGGVLEPQQSPDIGYTQVTWFVPCDQVTRWTASLTSDMTGTGYGLSGNFKFSPRSAMVIYFRIILIHQGAEQILVEYPLNLNSGAQTFTGFTQTGPDPAAGYGDALILELDPRGFVGSWTAYFGGTSGSSISIPEASVAAPANFNKHLLEAASPSEIISMDMDGDGDADIVTADPAVHQIAWWENTGNRNFLKHIVDSSFTFDGGVPGSLTAADLDGDGDVDLLAAPSSGTIQWWENLGGQVFTRHAINLPQNIYNLQVVLPVGLDRDGDMDILLAGNELGWLENNGHQQFTYNRISSIPSIQSVQVVDLDRDGHLDIIAACPNGALVWWKNNGAQVFTAQTILAGGNSTTSGGAVYAADLDGDGDIDILASLALSGKISWWENDGHEQFARHDIAAGFQASSLVAADMDGDGDVDIVAKGGATAWFEHTAGHNFIRHTITGYIRAMSVADLDSDGNPDIVGCSATQLLWWENNNPTPPPAAVLVAPSGTTNTTNPTYTWNPVPSATWYQLWVNDASASPKILQWYTAAQSNCGSGTGACSVTPEIALVNGTCRWWIQTWNDVGYGPWSSGMSFTVPGGPPGKATLISPSGSTSTSTPTYLWTAVSGSTWYYLWVNDATGNKIKNWYTSSQVGCAFGTGICSISPSVALTSGVAQWWIQTWNDYGYGPWSDGKVFAQPFQGDKPIINNGMR